MTAASSSSASVPAPLLCAQVLKGHVGPVQALRWNKEGKYVLTGGNDKSVRLWNPHTGMLIKTYKGHSYDVLGVAVTSDNSKIASCGEDRQPYLWDVASGKIVRKFRGHTARVNAVEFNTEDTVLLSAGYDRSLRFWDIRSNSLEPIQTQEDARDSVSAVCASSSTEIFTASIDGCVRAYDLRAGQLRTDTLGRPVTSVALSNDGNCILASCMDSHVHLLDKASGEELAHYTGHTHRSYKLQSAFSPTDAHVVSGSEDGSIFIWDLVEMSVVQRLSGHAGAVYCVSYAPRGGTALASSSYDGTVRVWSEDAGGVSASEK